MKYAVPNENARFTVDFLVDDEFVVPDSDSVTYSIRKTDGTAIATDVALTPAADHTTHTFVVSVGSTEGIFLLTINYDVGSVPYSATIPYRVATWVPLIATPDDVRSVLGITRDEVKDEEIDLLETYLTLAEDTPATDVSNFNRAVVYQAASDLLPSLPYRLAQIEKTDSKSVTRYKIDFDKLALDINGRLAALLSTLNGEATFDTVPLFSVVTPTDPVTGS